MPTPSFFESRATRLWSRRWALGIATFTVFLVLFGVILASTEFGIAFPVSVGPLLAVFLTAICWLWGLTLAGVWFHPSRGTTRIGSPWFLGAPRVAQIFFRWYFALFLTLWFLMPVLFVALLVVRWAAA